MIRRFCSHLFDDSETRYGFLYEDEFFAISIYGQMAILFPEHQPRLRGPPIRDYGCCQRQLRRAKGEELMKAKH